MIINNILSNFCNTDLSFLRIFNVIFFILIIILNLGLLYSEYLDFKNKKNDYVTAGVGNDIKKLSSILVAMISGVYGIITIKKEYDDRKKESTFQEGYEKIKSNIREIKAKNENNNVSQHLNLNSIEKSFEFYENIVFKKKTLIEKIQEKESLAEKMLDENSKKKLLEEISIMKRDKEALIVEELNSLSELNTDIKKGVDFSNEVKNQSDDEIMDKINNNISKSMVLNLDEWILNFESLNGLSKLAFSMIFSNSVIIWCLFSVFLNFYGNFLLDRFKLEERFPRIAKFIQYRKKISKYYIISNILVIFILCLFNIILGINLLSLYL